VAGIFVHEKHAKHFELPRLGGWWGNDEATRFEMKTGVYSASRAQRAGR